MKKLKTEDEIDGDGDDKEYRFQNKLMFQYRDKLSSLSIKEWHALLTYNNQEIPIGKDKVT